MNTHVDRRVVGHALPDGEVDPVLLGREVLRRSRVVLHLLDHVRGADTTREQDARGTERATGKNDTALRVQRDDAIGAKRRVVGADAGDRRAVAHDLGDHHVVLVHKVLALKRGLEVRLDRTPPLPVLEVERAVAVRVVLEVRVVVEGDLGEAGGVEELHDDVRGLGEVPLAVGRRVVRAGQAGLELVGVLSVADPAAWPAIGRREVAVGRYPVESA